MTQSSLVARSVGLLMALSGSAIGLYASSIDVLPPGLNPGDQYRLIFITSAGITAKSDNIADYDAFVSEVANASPLGSLGATWQAIVSTPTVSAADHLGASPVPIYRLDGQEVAAGTTGPQGLWSDGLNNPNPHRSSVLFDEKGDNAQLVSNIPGSNIQNIQLAWTGTAEDGSAENPLGGALNFGVGCTIVADIRWIDYQDFGDSSTLLPVYGISSVLTVPLPEPGPLGTLLTGTLLLGWACSQRLRHRPLQKLNSKLP